MKRIILFFILIGLIACKIFKQENVVVLYSDTSGFKIEVGMPPDWVDYKSIPVFLDEELLFRTYIGAKDTSSWIILDVYEFKSLSQNEIRIDSMLKWQEDLALTENKTTTVLARDTKKTASGKSIGFLDISVDNGKNGRDFRRTIVFYERKKAGILEINTKNDYNTFLAISNRFVETIAY